MAERWTACSLGEIANVVSDRATPAAAEGSMFVGLEHLASNSRSLSRWGDASEVSSQVTPFRPGDTLFGRLRPYLKKGCVAPTAGLCSTEILVVRPGNNVLDAFLGLLLLNDEVFAECDRLSAGSRMPRVSAKDLMALRLLIPPMEEQRRIVDLIGSIDTYINELEVQISETRKAEAALREDLFASLWTNERVAPLGTLLTIQRGSSPRPISKFLRNDGLGTPWIRIGDADPDSMFIETTAQCINLEGFTSPRFVYPGDFLLSNSMSFGRPYVSKIKGCIHDGWLRFSDENGVFSTEFLFNLMLSRALQERFAALAAGSGVKNLKIEKVASVEVPVPDRAGQQSIVETLERVRRVAAEATLQASAVRDLRAGVLSELLSGERLLDESYDIAVGL